MRHKYLSFKAYEKFLTGFGEYGSLIKMTMSGWLILTADNFS